MLRSLGKTNKIKIKQRNRVSSASVQPEIKPSTKSKSSFSKPKKQITNRKTK
jgi:hypothetical protein